ncbi:hypothetical protein EBT16_01980 [bacterium]|nr:hypothetical protein [bacterium]
MLKTAVFLWLGLPLFLQAGPAVYSSCPKIYRQLERGGLLNGGFAYGISVEEMQGIADSISQPGLPIGPLPGKTFEQVLINASYRNSFWEKLGVVIRDIAGSHLLNDGNHRVAFLITQRLIERNGIVRSPSNSDDQIYDLISKVGRKAVGYRTPEEIAAKLRGY